MRRLVSGPALLVLALALALLVPLAVRAGDGGNPPEEEDEISQTETETRVKKDLARRLEVEADTIRVLESEERTWESDLLGCHARRGLGDPTPVPGYRIVLQAPGGRHLYHTDRRGRFVRCSAPKKGFDRIQ